MTKIFTNASNFFFVRIKPSPSVRKDSQSDADGGTLRAVGA